MSRIGKKPIPIPEKVTVQVSPSNEVVAKGPKGELTLKVHPDLRVDVQGDQIVVQRPTDQKRHKALHGLFRALIANMVHGVAYGYEKKLELVGVGFRAQATGQLLELTVGYSHPVLLALPKEVKVSAEQLKGQNPIITLTSADKQLLGQVAAKIRSIRKPEPYKGKGIKFVDEVIRRKAGKSAATASSK